MRLSSKQLGEYRLLKNNGVEVVDEHTVSPHRGQETAKHYHAKAAVAVIGREHGYIVNGETPVPRGETDMLLWGNPERLTLAVEIEHNPDTEKWRSKYMKYIKDTPIGEMVLINADNLSYDILEMHEDIKIELGL